MSTTINERILKLRKSTGLGRTLFCREHGLKESTLTSIERGDRKPGADILAIYANAYPQYILWILTGTTNTKVGQIRPKAPTK
jgi:transcriptional regulator with XRE-family HTH domain